MQKKEIFCALIGALAVGCAFCSPSLSFDYDLNHLGGQRWQYSYTVENFDFEPDIYGFIVYFDYGLYSNLASETPDSLTEQWDEVVVSPFSYSNFSPFEGYYDALSVNEPITVGHSVSGLSVSFDWLGAGSPGGQAFEIYSPETWETISSGMTETEQVGVIPAPGAVCLGVFGFILTAAFRKS